MKNEIQILVAIHCLVYNHEPYLYDCFEGFVMQKTDFRFVAIVHDDCSTDGSAAIIREYAEKYPEIFRPIYETENQWHKHDSSVDRVMYDAIVRTGAKYVAMCEGDDYWTDPLKLQKQVDYLENHPQCSCCAHNALTLITKKREIGLFNTQIFENNDYSLDTFLTNGWFTPTASLMYRSADYHRYEDIQEFMHGDYSLTVNLLLKEGTYLHYDDEIMSVYRCGGWASVHFKQIELCDDFIKLLTYYEAKSNHRYDEVFDELIENQKKEKQLALQYLQDTKKSHSLYVRIGHWLCRMIAKAVNQYVNCIHVEKYV